jgi:ADP-ribose pyrophosphatase YjhB (NUDIX family)
MDNEVRPLRLWNDGELREYETVTVGDRRFAIVRVPRMEARQWALPGGFSDAEGSLEAKPPREAG